MDGGQNCSRTDFCLAIYGWGNILLVRLTVSVDGQKAVNGYEFSNWPWLPLFYDLRTLLTHYAAPFPVLKENFFLVDVDNPSGLLQLKQGQQKVEFAAVLEFADKLVTLLDIWALHNLQAVDPKTETFQIHCRSFFGPLKGKKTTVRPFLRMAREFRELALKSTDKPQIRDLLAGIHIKC